MNKSRATATPTGPERAVLLKEEAAAYLGISTVTLYRLTRAGKVPHLRLGRLLRWRKEDLDAFLAASSTTEWEDFREEKG
jgi:excisionase family DNA binding protein